MSAECGVPTYRGKERIQQQYNREEYACQSAFENGPETVLKFHELCRRKVLGCKPHQGHKFISQLQKNHLEATIITQNIDEMHQEFGSTDVIKLHSSLWRFRCSSEWTLRDNIERNFKSIKCECGAWLRPDIIWFGDNLDRSIVKQIYESSGKADLFISMGTSGEV